MFARFKKFLHNLFATRWEKEIKDSSFSFSNSKNKSVEDKHLVYNLQINICNNHANFVSILTFCNKYHYKYAKLRETLKKAGFNLERNFIHAPDKVYWKIDTSSIQQCQNFINVVNLFESLEEIAVDLHAILSNKNIQEQLNKLKKWQLKQHDYYRNDNHLGIANQNLIYALDFDICTTVDDAISISINCNEEHKRYPELCQAFHAAGFTIDDSRIGWAIDTTDIEACKTFLTIVNEFEALENIYDNLFSKLNDANLPSILANVKKWACVHSHHIRPNIYYDNELHIGIDNRNLIRSIELDFCDDEDCEGAFVFNCNENKSNYNDFCKALNQAGFTREPNELWSVDIYRSERCKKFLEIVDQFEPLENIRDEIFSIINNIEHINNFSTLKNNNILDNFSSRFFQKAVDFSSISEDENLIHSFQLKN